ncbi:hypothetical protein [Rhodohalobacter mucosus]|uniref:Uncharacterized protein n=1 Tax=Rhodohalobacter mucosus TaxID=2079485 RepID=A0A316TSI3_9BACT|nr:hypothetical protein [Rhodohalobacter mucosus]PWN05192.1 hypothetical protein DDZ15_15825 [Rhodohalobacter mucosus]
MILRTFKAPTLIEARKKAVDEYGSHFIILESREASGRSPAQVTVGIQKETEHRRQEKTHASGMNEPSAKHDSQQAGTFFEPFLKQFGNLVASSTETLKTLRSDAASASKTDGTESALKNRTGARSVQGVTFERSSAGRSGTGASPDMPELSAPANISTDTVSGLTKETDIVTDEKRKEATEFRQHYRRPSPPRATAGAQMGALSRKVSYLEKLILELHPASSTGFSNETWYRHLRQCGFPASLLDAWAEQTSGRPAFTREELDSSEIKSHLFDKIDSFFTPRSMHDDHPFHLFSCFEGTDPIPMMRAVLQHNKRRGVKTRVALLFSSRFDLDEQGLMMMEMLTFHKIETETVVSHRDWERLLESRHKNETILASAIPLHMDHDEISERWDHMNRILGERHSVKHHLLAHSIQNPEAVCGVLPSEHPFTPDFISLTHFGAARGSLGNLAAYRDSLQCPFGYLHHLTHSDAAADALFSKPATSLLKTDSTISALNKIAG